MQTRMMLHIQIIIINEYSNIFFKGRRQNMPQLAAASCYLLSVMPQPLADMSNDDRCLNYDL